MWGVLRTVDTIAGHQVTPWDLVPRSLAVRRDEIGSDASLLSALGDRRHGELRTLPSQRETRTVLGGKSAGASA